LVETTVAFGGSLPLFADGFAVVFLLTALLTVFFTALLTAVRLAELFFALMPSNLSSCAHVNLRISRASPAI
jgi:hypothetical protein